MLHHVLEDLIEPDELAYSRIVNLAARALDVPVAVFACMDLERQFFRAYQGLTEEHALSCAPLCAAVMMSGESLAVENLRLHPRLRELAVVQNEPGLRGFGGVCVRDPQGLPVGALWVADQRKLRLSDVELETLSGFGGLIQRELLLRKLARTDFLTGLGNGTFWEHDLEREWRRARRHRHAVSVLVLDIDDMRGYNDAFGYEAGNLAIRAVASVVLNTYRRASDLLVRAGGDRILALLPETTSENALRLSERLRAEVSDLAIGNAEAGSTLTVSIGCATADSEAALATGPNRLVEQAELALAEAKRSGGNRVCSAGSSGQIYAAAIASG